MAIQATTQGTRSLSHSSSYSSIDSEYFFKTYVPLTNLPTPPLSTDSSLDSSRLDDFPFEIFAAGGEILNPELLGPAVHLVNLIPSATSLTSPSVSLVQAILERAALPTELLAFAVCILDSLSSRFALSWRRDFPLTNAQPRAQLIEEQSTQLPQSPCGISSSQMPTSPFDLHCDEYHHIDDVHPELLILCALVLAAKFLDDNVKTTVEYSNLWGFGIWSCRQIEFTQRCILENLGYRLLAMCDESIIKGALKDMKRAGNVESRRASRSSDDQNSEDEQVQIGRASSSCSTMVC